MKRFENLNFCLGHFGGIEEWERQILGNALREGEDTSWLTTITDMMTKDGYTNLYANISYTLFCQPSKDRQFNYSEQLKVILNDEKIRSQVLFGTDFYMVQLEKSTDKEVSIALRAHLGEELYFHLAYQNPRRYLYDVLPAKFQSKGKAPTRKSRKS